MFVCLLWRELNTQLSVSDIKIRALWVPTEGDPSDTAGAVTGVSSWGALTAGRPHGDRRPV